MNCRECSSKIKKYGYRRINEKPKDGLLCGDCTEKTITEWPTELTAVDITQELEL